VSDLSPQSSVPLAAGTSAISVAKAGVVRGGGAAVVGSIVDYTFTVTNTGTLSVTDPVFTDPKPGLSAIGGYSWPTATVGLVPPGQSATATATYTVRQGDFDGGAVRNTASATATPSRGAASVSGTSTPSVIPTPAAAPLISIDKTQVLAAAATGRAGDAVLFRWVVTNTGDVTLTGVSVSDPQLPAGSISYAFPGASGVLAPGAEVIATATYILTQADVDAGRIASSATTTGKPPTGANVTDTALGETLVVAAPAMTVTKTSSTTTFAQQGATLNYRIEVRNTGNVTLTGVTVTDVKTGLSALSYSWPGTPGTLHPNGLLVVTARYTITAADVASGTIDNTATANANAPGGVALAPVADTDTFAVPRVAAVGITVSPRVQSGQAGFAGDTVVVTYVVRNNGTEPLSNVEITDPRTGLSTIVFGRWPGPAGVLLPGESVTATASFVITPSMEGQRLEETASVTSADLNSGDPVLASAIGAVQLPVRAIDPGGLIKTGTDAEYPLGAALLLLLSGLGLILIGRRKQRKVAS